MKKILTLVFALALVLAEAGAQEALKRVYDESADPMTQIDDGIAKARAEGKHVLCQVGGNWCPWCLMFADFAEKDTAVHKAIDDSYVYLHVNYNPRRAASSEAAQQATALMQRLGNPARFGFPVFVVLDGEGRVLHTQDSSFLEEGRGYNEQKVLRFLKNWTPAATGK